MPTYCGISGVVRKLKEWPIGIGGVVKQQKEVWTAEGGVSRKIFSTKNTYTVKIKNDNSADDDRYKYQANVEILGVRYTYQDDGTVLTVEEGAPLICTAKGGGVYVNGSLISNSSSLGYTHILSSNVNVLINIQITSTPVGIYASGTIRINSV